MKPAEAVEPIVAFAKTHRLRIKRDDCNDLNVIGRRGDIYDYGDGTHFCVTVRNCLNAFHWNKYRQALEKAGCRITQNGDMEGTALFVPTSSEQIEIALQAIRVYRKRKLTESQLANLKVDGEKTRFKPRKTHSELPDDSEVDPDPETRF